MAFINLKTKEIQLKIIYWGPGRGGKTTNLEYIYKNYHSKLKSKMLKITVLCTNLRQCDHICHSYQV
jgi:GTPase SAR1 family protein